MDVTAGHAAAIYRGTAIFAAPKSELKRVFDNRTRVYAVYTNCTVSQNLTERRVYFMTLSLLKKFQFNLQSGSRPEVCRWTTKSNRKYNRITENKTGNQTTSPKVTSNHSEGKYRPIETSSNRIGLSLER